MRGRNEMRRGQNALGNIRAYNIVEDGLVNVKVKAFKKNEVTGKRVTKTYGS